MAKTFYNEKKWQQELKKAYKTIDILVKRVEELEKENTVLKKKIINKTNRFDIMDLEE